MGVAHSAASTATQSTLRSSVRVAARTKEATKPAAISVARMAAIPCNTPISATNALKTRATIATHVIGAAVAAAGTTVLRFAAVVAGNSGVVYFVIRPPRPNRHDNEAD